MGFVEGFYIKPRIDWPLLYGARGGARLPLRLPGGEIPQKLVSGQYEAAMGPRAGAARALWGRLLPGDTAPRHTRSRVNEAAAGLIRLHRETGIPLALTNDAHYIDRDDAYFQDVLMCIQTGKTVNDAERMRFETREFYLKSEQEMRALFPELRRRRTIRSSSPGNAATTSSSATTTCRASSCRRGRRTATPICKSSARRASRAAIPKTGARCARGSTTSWT